MTDKKIKVLVVDDSLVSLKFLSELIVKDPRFELAGTAMNGQEAIEKVVKSRPDVVSMDVNMPIMDGVEATREIMHKNPVPILIVTSLFPSAETVISMQVLEAGAVGILPKPFGPGHPKFYQSAKKYLNMLESMSEMKVVLRRTIPSTNRLMSFAGGKNEEKENPPVRILVIGASAGGPEGIKTILGNLPESFPIPVLIVQHIDPLFAEDFCNWIKIYSTLPVKIAVHGEPLVPGTVYLPPGNRHLRLLTKETIAVTEEAPVRGIRPSVGLLFQSSADVFGKNTVAVLLSGMGNDGAAEMKTLYDLGALTIAQKEQSCLVYGMPGVAVGMGAARKILTPAEIVIELRNLFNL